MGAMGCHFGHAGCSVDIRGTTIRATGDAVSPVGALTCCGEPQWYTGATREASVVLWGVAMDMHRVWGGACGHHGGHGVLWQTHCPWGRSPMLQS